MFPSSGYFRGIDCPFFASGLCDRPNCHFRHIEESSSQVPVYIPTVQSKPSSLLGLVGVATKQLSRSSIETSHSNSAPQYIPTPISVLEQLKKQKANETSSVLQRVTLADVAQFTAEGKANVDDVSVSQIKPVNSNSKRKLDEVNSIGEESSLPKKTKLASSVTELNISEPNVEQCHHQNSGSITCNKQNSHNKDVNNKTKNGKLIHPEKCIKKVGEISAIKRENKKNVIKKDEARKDSLGKNECKVEKNYNVKNVSKDVRIKSSVRKDSLPMKKIPSSLSLDGDSKKVSNVATKEPRDKSLLPVNGSISKHAKVKPKGTQVIKSKDASKKQQTDLESLKIAESLQLEVALFGNPISGGSPKSKTKKLDGDTSNLLSKSICLKTDRKAIKEGRALEQTLSCKNKEVTKDERGGKSAFKQNQKFLEGVNKNSLTNPNGGSVKWNKKDGLECSNSERGAGFGSSDLEPSDIDGDDDEDDDDDDVSCDVGNDEDDVMMRMKECYRIFMEPHSKKQKQLEKPPVAQPPRNEGMAEPVLAGKKRVAHLSGSINASEHLVMKKPKVIKDHRKVMLERFSEAQKKQMNEVVADEANRPSAKVDHFSGLSAKGSQRVAHIPSKEVLKRPMITHDVSSSFVPINYRQMQLNKIIDKCLEIYDAEQDAYTRSLEEEKKLMTNCASKFTYNARLVSLMMILNHELKAKRIYGTICGAQPSHSSRDRNFTVNRCGSLEPPPLTASEMYKRLKPYVLTEDQLKVHGFPFRDPSSKAILVTPHKKYSREYSSDANHKICCRCSKEFVILKNGNYLRKEECVYHWGPCWKKRIAGNIDSRYNCCGGSSYDRGCEVAECHVHEDNKFGNLTGFVNTLPCSPRLDDDYGIFALDCEMIYTVAGSELARVTVIDFNLKVVYDKLVRPDSQIIDYNTRFSGIKKEDMENVKTSLRDVQAVLLSMFNDKTILIGHSLENDLLSLKLLHQNIVDTSVVFPHKLGFPYKRALRNLSVEILKKSIQQNSDGHDSKEDASACMELMIHKAKEDMKKSMRIARDLMLSNSRPSFF